MNVTGAFCLWPSKQTPSTFPSWYMEVFDYFCQRCFKEWPSPAKKTTLFILHLEDWEQRLERWSRLESVRKAREELFGSFPLRV